MRIRSGSENCSRNWDNPVAAGVSKVDVCLRFGNLHSRFHASNEVQGLEESVGESVPARRNLGFHRERNPEVRGLTYRRAKEFAGSYANERVNG